LAEHGPGQVILVPGGGPFADAVRAGQQVWNFPDRTAHRMALLGMRQFGLMLCGLEPKLTEAPAVAAVKKILAQGGLPVWMPEDAELDAAGVPASWDITSDSLAAWLAGETGAGEVLLVKSCPVAGETSLERLVAEGAVDPALPDYLNRAGCGLRIAFAEDSGRLATLLASC
jgi:aspartokinase-like uncharacterized kinase